MKFGDGVSRDLCREDICNDDENYLLNIKQKAQRAAAINKSVKKEHKPTELS